LLARLYLSRNDPASASRVLAEAGSTATADAGMNWLEGASLLLSGNTAGAIASLEKGAEADPGNVPLKLDLVQAYLAAGRREDALGTLQAIGQGEGGLRRRQLSVLAEVAGRSLADARPGIDRLVAASPQDSVLLATAASYLFGAGDIAGAGKLFEQAITADPKNVDAHLGLATIALRTRDTSRASEQLHSVLEIEPSNERAHLGLAFAALIQGDRKAARDWLERAVSADPAVVESRLRLAEMALADGDPIRAKAMIDQALAVTKARPATLARAGQLYLAASQYDDALARFNEAAALGDRDADASAGVTLMALGRNDEARARLEAAAKKRPDWAVPVLYLAALDSGAGRFDQALKRVDAFQQAGGAAHVADEIRGNVLLAAKRPAEAVAAYERSAKGRPSAALAIKLYQARRAAGRPEPEASLRAWLSDHPGDQSVRVLLAEHYQLAGDRGKAISQYEQVLQASPDAPPVMNNLAWLYYETGDARAQDLARRAHEAAADNPEIADTYGWILVELGDAKAGLPVLEAAVKGRPEHPEIRYHYAVALSRNGQAKAAAEVLRKLLADTKAFPSRSAAQALLDQLSRKELGL
jgi:putative PEP-CTERM system TPR-repeat lipoprotein